MRPPFPVDRNELLTTCYRTLRGYDAKKPNKPLKPVTPYDLYAEVNMTSLQMRDYWLLELRAGLLEMLPIESLCRRYQWVVEKVKAVDEVCAETLEEDVGAESDRVDIADRTAYGLAVLHWYRLLNQGKVDALLDFTVEECDLWIRNYKESPPPPPPPPEPEQLALF